MAEAVVSLVVNRLTLMLAEDLTEWLRVGSYLHRKVTDIKDELESIQCFLRDADERAEKTEDQHINNGVESWVKQVRQVAYRIEDVIDEYMLRVAPQGVAFDARYFQFSKSIKKINSLVKNFRLRHEIGSEIEGIRASLVEIKNRSERYRLISSSESSRARGSTPWLDPRVASHFISDTDVMGIDEVKRGLIGLLVGEPSKRKVIAVEGMGGLGKTTLAKVVYESSITKEHFLCSAWITVSQSYKKGEIFNYLARHFCAAQESSLEEDHAIGMPEEVWMISKIRKSLQGKRYVVVFDDVWNVNFWGEIEHAFLDDNVGSRILITTRNKDVANFCKKSSLVHVHELQLLPPSFAWELFCKTAFQFDSEEHKCPKMLESLSSNIVQKCGGLPLAIVVIGGLLSTKDKSLEEWKKLHDALHSELESNPHLTSITMILSLSYRDLPYYLKCCFLYFGIFPEDYTIIFSRLIRLWIAEGFVRAKQGRTLEEVAEGYIAELSQRNMIHSYWGFSGVIKCCKVHDLMRETIFSLIGKLSYCQVLDAEKEFYPSLNREARRLSVHNNIGNILKNERVAIRSFFVFSTTNELDKAAMDTLFESLRLLKVLDLEDCRYVNYLPENVGNLLHLRYLCVTSMEIKNLPKSIGKLLNLETLNLADTQVQELPKEIYRLRRLRHLVCGRFNSEIDYGLDSRRGVRIHKGIGELQDLQTLAGVKASEDWIEELTKLTQLRVFDLVNVTAKMGTTLCNAINNMSNLKSVDLNLKNDQRELLDFDSILALPPLLWNLCLRGRLKNLHFFSATSPCALQNVVTIRLFLSGLTQDPLKSLQALPNLMHLDVSYEAYRGERLHIEAGWFQKLQVLTLKRLEKLRALSIENGALPLLRKLVIGPQNMKELPHDIIYLRNLEKLAIREMPREFVRRILPEGGEDYWKLEHIPVVRVHFKIRGNYFQSFKLGDSGLLDHLQIS